MPLRHVSQCFMALLFVFISFTQLTQITHIDTYTHTSQMFTDDTLSSINIECMYTHTLMVKAQRNPYGLVDPYDKSGSNTKWKIPRNFNILVKKWSKDNERNAITKCWGSPIGFAGFEYGLWHIGFGGPPIGYKGYAGRHRKELKAIAVCHPFRRHATKCMVENHKLYKW